MPLSFSVAVVRAAAKWPTTAFVMTAVVADAAAAVASLIRSSKSFEV